MLGNIITGSYIYANNSSIFVLAEVAYTFADAEVGTSLHAQGVISILPGALRDTTLDFSINVKDPETQEIPKNGIEIGAFGNFDEFGTEATVRLSIGAIGTFIANTLRYNGYTPVRLRPVGEFSIEQPNRNVVWWSDIGNLDFTIGRSNVAGKTYLDMKGWIYQVKKLDKRLVAYGENGVAILTPSDKYYGTKIIHRLGVKSKLAVAGNDEVHWFIDTADQLWQISDKLEKLDYSEYLTVLTDPVMSYDILNGLIYICDGTYGFIYSPESKSLGSGPVNVSGIAYQDGTFMSVAPAAITTPTFEICTDIYDFGSRKNKTIHQMEFGTDFSGTLNASIDYRANHKSAFANTGWNLVTHEGICFVKAYGIEFRFRLKALAYVYLELDKIHVKGVIHRFSPTDI